MSKPNIIKLEQDTPEWRAFRMGKVTGSRMHQVYSIKAPTKPQIAAKLDEHSIKYKNCLLYTYPSPRDS